MKKVIFAAAIVAIAAVSCVKTDEEGVITSYAQDGMQFKSYTSASTKANSITTKTLSDENFTLLSWRTAGDFASVVGEANIASDVLSCNEYIWSTTKSYYWSTDAVDRESFFATNAPSASFVAPVDAAYYPSFEYTVEADAADMKDVLVANTMNKETGTVALDFYHALAKVNFKAVGGGDGGTYDYTDESDFQYVYFSDAGITEEYLSTTLDYTQAAGVDVTLTIDGDTITCDQGYGYAQVPTETQFYREGVSGSYTYYYLDGTKKYVSTDAEVLALTVEGFTTIAGVVDLDYSNASSVGYSYSTADVLSATNYYRLDTSADQNGSEYEYFFYGDSADPTNTGAASKAKILLYGKVHYEYTVESVTISALHDAGTFTYTGATGATPGTWVPTGAAEASYDYALSSTTPTGLDTDIIILKQELAGDGTGTDNSLLILPQTGTEFTITVEYTVTRTDTDVELVPSTDFSGEATVEISDLDFACNSNTTIVFTVPSPGEIMTFKASVSDFDTEVETDTYDDLTVTPVTVLP